MRNAGRLLLPIGTTNYKKICDNYYYVDKTLMIKDILEDLKYGYAANFF